ncbi:MAG: XRE family transcriptional regulator [gamma proteobacterium symbiont of Taylorina sp.]|nr:XRE family transcriptional regulator [gamma proteobacterium symbiont of Taylorina sp.]
MMSELIIELFDASGYVSPKALAKQFHTTIKEVAVFSGLSQESVSRHSRVHSKTSQKRLRDIILIMNKVLPWSGSPMQAYAWYRSEQLPGFGGLTAEDLVKRGMANDVLDYITELMDGGFA